MNNAPPPTIELIGQSLAPTRRWRRWHTFVLVLLLAGILGSIAVYSRTPVYSAAATVLTIKPKIPGSYSAIANAEHAEIQRKLLLSESLLTRLLTHSNGLDLAELESMLSVNPKPGTNLLELKAKGNDPAQVRDLANQWAKSYETDRMQQIESETGRITARVEDQKARLESKISAARKALRDYRQKHAIVGIDRGENRAMAALSGLNRSLDQARQRQTDAQARKEAIDAARSRGETVVPDDQRAHITQLRLAAQKTRDRLKELRKRYTQAYIDRDPKLKELPVKLRQQEQALAEALKVAEQTLKQDTDQELETARRARQSLEAQLQAQQAEAQDFNDTYAEYKTLNDDLRRMEALLAEQNEQLLKVQIENQQKFPSIEIIELARLPRTPIYPDYQRDLMIVLAAAFLLAVFMTWLVEYLSGKPEDKSPQLGVNLYAGNAQALPPMHDVNTPLPNPVAAPLQAPAQALPEQTLPRDLNSQEISALLAQLDAPTGAYATLLLSGISPYELPLLTPTAFDTNAMHVNVPGSMARSIELPPSVWQRISPLLSAQPELNLRSFDHALIHAAAQAGLNNPATINALVLWHSYVMYLVHQGIDGDTLRQRTGEILPGVRTALQAVSSVEIETVHPALLLGQTNNQPC